MCTKIPQAKTVAQGDSEPDSALCICDGDQVFMAQTDFEDLQSSRVVWLNWLERLLVKRAMRRLKECNDADRR
jgi:hypothetical protein